MTVLPPHGRRPNQILSTEYCADVGTTFNVKTTTTTTTTTTTKTTKTYHTLLTMTANNKIN